MQTIRRPLNQRRPTEDEEETLHAGNSSVAVEPPKDAATATAADGLRPPA